MKSLVIEKKDVIHNIEIIQNMAKRNGKSDTGRDYEIIAVVKGNGYGLGLIEFSRLLVEHGIKTLAVSTAEEALKLKEEKIKADVILLASICDEKEVQELIQNDVILTIGSNKAAEIANNLVKENKVKVHIKIDTGFGRYGFLYNQEKEIIDAYTKFQNLEIVGTFSHFSQSYAKNEKYTNLQFERFMKVIEMLKMNDINPGLLHICNSTAFLRYPNMHLNAARIGSAFLGRVLVDNNVGLKKVGSFETKIIEIKMLPKGYNIGYSCTEKTKRETRIGIIPVRISRWH